MPILSESISDLLIVNVNKDIIMQKELISVAKHVASNTKYGHDEGCGPYRECHCYMLERAKVSVERYWRKYGLWEE